MVLGHAAAHWWHGNPQLQAPVHWAGLGVQQLHLAQGAPALEASPFANAGIALFTAAQTPAHSLLSSLRARAERALPRTTRHGVFLSVHGLGVLVTGPSGVGKSELSLDLIARGHQLVADDAVSLFRAAPGLVVGECEPLLVGFMEARGLGVLNIAAMYGKAAVRSCERLDLVIRLEDGPRPFSGEERLHGRRGLQEIAEVAVPFVVLARSLGHNLAPLVEAACRDHWLRQNGYAADQDFMAQQLALIAPL